MKSFLYLALFSCTALLAEDIVLKKGQEERIELESNPTTGYSWYTSKDVHRNAPISIVKSGYKADNTGLVGSGGKQFWVIRGKKKGTYTFNLLYKRPWEKDVAPAEIKTFEISIE